MLRADEEVRASSRPLTIGPTTVEPGSKAFTVGSLSLKLRKFQEELMDAKGHVVLKAPTGSGKTLTLLLLNKENVVGVYPSRALVNDQFDSVSSLLSLGCQLEREENNFKVYDCGNKKYIIVKITSESLQEGGWRALEEVCKEVQRYRDLGANSVVFTVPEYPYYTLSGEYGEFYKIGTVLKELKWENPEDLINKVNKVFPRSIQATKRFCAELLFTDTLFFDEFHAYSGKSFYGALALTAIYTSLPFLETRIILSSATHTDHLELMLKLIEEYDVVEAKEGREVVRGTLQGEAILYESKWPGAAAFAYSEEIFPIIVKNKIGKIKEYVKNDDKVILIADKIATVYQTVQALKQGGISDVVCVTSLSEELGCAGNPREASVIVGNEAISYGIDIKELKYGIITAKTWYQLVQRVGRLGRGREVAEATLLFPRKIERELNSPSMSWNEFVEWSKRIYPPKPANWFEKTGLGGHKVDYVLRMYELTTYIVYRDKFRVSTTIKKSIERSKKALTLLPKGGKVHLGALATFRFSSFRGSSDEWIIKARNFKIEVKPEGVEMTKEPVRGYLGIWLNSNDKDLDQVMNIIDNLQGKVVQLNAVIELLSKWSPRVVQVIKGEIHPLGLIRNIMHSKDPVYVIPIRGRGTIERGVDEGYARYLLSVEDAMALLIKSGVGRNEARLLGVLVRA